jgi:hypothetical protein
MDLGVPCDVTGTGEAPTSSKPDISAYTSCLILPGHDLKPSWGAISPGMIIEN